MNNWKLSNDVEYQSLKRAFPDKDERMKFLQDFLHYSKVRVAEFDEIERKLPRDRNYELYYDSRTWQEKTLTGLKKGAKMTIDHLENYVKDFYYV